MPALIESPNFQEGQILGADDLRLLLGYLRDQEARHSRYSHLWGIVEGLSGSIDSNKLSLSKGMAIDSSGRPIIVTDDRTFDRRELSLASSPNEGTYPLFITATSQSSDQSSLVYRCTTDGRSRIRESYAVQLGQPHEAAQWDTIQTSPSVGEGPETSPASTRRVLLGFVEIKNSQFSKFLTENEDGVHPRYVGVRAAIIEAINGRLDLRTRPQGDDDAPAFVMDANNSERIVAIGKVDSLGKMQEPPLLVLKSNGDLEVKRVKQSTPLDASRVYVGSGTITDGLVIPLPSGVVENDLGPGTQVQIQLTPRVDRMTPPVDGWVGFVTECQVDTARKVQCVFQWREWQGQGFQFTSGICDYLIVVETSTDGGAK